MGKKNSLRAKVLIIDDDIDMTELVKELLSNDQFEVFPIYQGLEGISMVQKIKPDIVILEMTMPDKSGLEVCKEIRKFSRVPILVLSAVSTPGISAQILNEGADDFLEKPMNSNILNAHINKLIRRSPGTNKIFPQNPINDAQPGLE